MAKIKSLDELKKRMDTVRDNFVRELLNAICDGFTSGLDPQAATMIMALTFEGMDEAVDRIGDEPAFKTRVAALKADMAKKKP